MRYLPLYLPLVMIALLTASCDAFEGPQGPSGAANVQTIELEYSSSEIQEDGRHGTVSWTVEEITTDVYESGSVQAYMYFGDSWLALPYTWTDALDTMEITYVYGEEEFMLVFEKDTSGTNMAFPVSTIKVVIIPPEESSGSTSKHKMGG